MLAVGHFMMAVLHRYSHLFKLDYGLPAQVHCQIQRGHVEVATPIKKLRSFRIFEIKVLELWTDIVGKAHVGSLFHISLQYVPGITLKGLPFRPQDIAEHPGHTVLRGPPG